MSSPPEGLHFDLERACRTAQARVAVLPAGEPEPYDEELWRDSLVLVQSGQLRMTCLTGAHAVFGAGSVVHLRGLSLSTIGADGDADAVLLVISR